MPQLLDREGGASSNNESLLILLLTGERDAHFVLPGRPLSPAMRWP
jgi:hypothetical protein